ncbi:hypothetical protein N5D52_21600 [Pseudomonas sp. GD03860]|nr:hypothetical protein [Pseudomonas sp. GD03860]MDH0639532.1 hypothetical protein [Pseudomonas sp. GD03860]
MDRTWTSLPSRLEAMLGQHLYAYGHSTRPYARNDWNLAQESADLTEIAQGTSPGSWVQDPELLHCCQLQGFRPTYLGELSTYRILFHLNGCRAGETKTYLLTSAGHALGLAMRRGEIALFDSNTGLTLYSVEEALDNAHLMHCLNLLLAGATFHQFGVLQLTF